MLHSLIEAQLVPLPV
jgi:hypothetical protein